MKNTVWKDDVNVLEIRQTALPLAMSALIHTAVLAGLGLVDYGRELKLQVAPVGSYEVELVTINFPPCTKGKKGKTAQPVPKKMPINTPLPKGDFKEPVEKAPLEETEVKTEAISGVDVPSPRPELHPHESRDALAGRLYNNEGTILGKSDEAGQPSGLHEKGDSPAGRVGGGEVVDVEFGSSSGPSFLKMVRPAYPRLARRLGKEGKVVLRLFIDKDGRLLNMEIVERAGFGFDEAAIYAVKASTFKPARMNGMSVASTALLPIIFKLE